MRKKYFVAWTMGLVLLGQTMGLLAKGNRPPAPAAALGYSGWMIYWQQENCDAALQKYQRDLEHVSLFAARFTPDYNLTPADRWVADRMTRSKNTRNDDAPPLFLTAINDVSSNGKVRSKDPGVVSAILHSKELTEKHINDLLRFSEPIQGIEIDYENIRAKDRELFSSFIQNLAARLHERGKKLIVVVQPKTYESNTDGDGAIDWSEIGKHADMVKIIAYRYHAAGGEPGPLSPPNWLIDISNFALTQIPRSKLCIALSMEGSDWPHGGEATPINYISSIRLARSAGAKIERDASTQSPHFTYNINGLHEVWFEDALSMQKKIEALRRVGVQHVAFWWLGAGEESVLDQMAMAGEQLP